MKRSKSVQIYLKAGIEQDDLLLALWAVCRLKSRPQEIFRGMLLRGYESMRASGDIPESILEALGEALEEGLPEVPVKKSPPRKTVPARQADPFPPAKPAPVAPKPQDEEDDSDRGQVEQEVQRKAGGADEAPARPATKAPFHIGDIM
jgi:hypothetical protein